MAAGTCGYCGCTETTPCEGGCAWADAARTLCTTCRGAESIAEKFVEVLGSVIASRRVRLIASAWVDLTHDQRQLLVMTCRATSEAIAETLVESQDDTLYQAAVELNAITGFLLERLPDAELRPEESVSQVVMRLLEPHIGSRIVLP